MSDKSKSILRKNMRLFIAEGIVAMPIVFISMPGNFLLANLVTGPLNLSNTIYGLIASLPAWCNVAQLFATPFLTRYFKQKNICLTFSYFHAAAWMTLAWLLPYFPKDGSHSAIVFIVGILAIISFTFAIINISWTSWISECLPQKSRGKYLGRRNRVLQISTVVFLLLAGKTLSLFSDGEVIQGFQIVIVVGVGLRLLSIKWQQHIYSLKSAQQEMSTPFSSQIGTILRNKPLVRFILFGTAFNFAANLVGPFMSIFFFKALHMEVFEVGYLVVLATTTGALTMSRWGELFDKYGCRPILAIALIAWMLNGYFFLFATPDRIWIVYLLFSTGGIFGAGFIFGIFNMTLKLIPPDAKTTAISLNLAVSSLAGAISPVIGGAALEWAEARYAMLDIFHTFSAFHHSIVLVTVLILLTVQEPRSSTLLQAAGAMRPLRHAGALLGISFLASHVFIKKKPKTTPSESSPPETESAPKQDTKS